jgi:hypothetical protein
MKFETHNAKYEDHEVFTSVNPKFPTLRLFENDQYALGIALHKWKNESTDIKVKGEFLCVYVVCGFSESWDSIDLSDAYQVMQDECDTIKDFDISSLENGTYTDESILVYKFSVNVWRRVEYIGKKTKKWTFVDEKPNKDSNSKVQRLLND